MDDWENVQARKAALQQEAIAPLDEQERAILGKLYELEWESRHFRTTDVRRELRQCIQQVIT